VKFERDKNMGEKDVMFIESLLKGAKKAKIFCFLMPILEKY
jgi:hypothetical protein